MRHAEFDLLFSTFLPFLIYSFEISTFCGTLSLEKVPLQAALPTVIRPVRFWFHYFHGTLWHPHTAQVLIPCCGTHPTTFSFFNSQICIHQSAGSMCAAQLQDNGSRRCWRAPSFAKSNLASSWQNFKAPSIRFLAIFWLRAHNANATHVTANAANTGNFERLRFVLIALTTYDYIWLVAGDAVLRIDAEDNQTKQQL